MSVETRMERLEQKTNLITPKIKDIWHQALDAPIDVGDTWLHGDLHPRNIIIENGSIAGIIDWGNLTSGDIATDLASIWMLFSEINTRQQAIDAYGYISDATLQRTLGWAILFGVFLLDTGLLDHPRHKAMGEKILHCISSDLNILSRE